MNIKVSVCIITYNHQDFIKDAIESSLNQKCNFPFEVIVIEDCSTDNTRKKIKEIEKKDNFRVFFREKNSGVMANYELAFKEARGEYIAFLDGDDMMLDGKLERQARELDKDSSLAICSHPLIYFNNKFNVMAKVPLLYKNNIRYNLYDLLVKGFVFSHSSKMFRKDSLPSIGIDQNTKNCTDYLLHMQNCLKGDILHLNIPLGMHRVHSSSLSQLNRKGSNLLKAYNDQLYAIEKISGELEKSGNYLQYKEALKKARKRIKSWLVKSLIKSLIPRIK